jgi:hypothetical protein
MFTVAILIAPCSSFSVVSLEELDEVETDEDDGVRVEGVDTFTTCNNTGRIFGSS